MPSNPPAIAWKRWTGPFPSRPESTNAAVISRDPATKPAHPIARRAREGNDEADEVKEEGTVIKRSIKLSSSTTRSNNRSGVRGFCSRVLADRALLHGLTGPNLWPKVVACN